MMRASISLCAAVWMTLMALALGGGVLGFALVETALYNTAHWTGWTLLALSIGAALYRARGRGVRSLRVSASTLFAIHIGLGALAALLFAVHAGGAPRGAFALALWSAYASVLLSGAVGLICEKALARTRRSQAPYARIAIERDEIERRAHQAYQRLATERAPPPSLPFANYYARQLLPYFAAHAHWREHWRGGRARARNDMLHAMEYWGDELGDDPNYRELLALIQQKYALDRRYALYWLQRGWLFVHLPAVAAAGVLTAAHIFAAHAFGG